MHYMGTEAEYPVYQPGLEREPVEFEEGRLRLGHPSESRILHVLLNPRYLPDGVVSSSVFNSGKGFLNNGDRWYPEAASKTIAEMATGERLGPLATTVCDQRGIVLVRHIIQNVLASGVLGHNRHIADVPFYLLRRTVDFGQNTTGHHINMPIPRNLYMGLPELAPVCMGMIGGMALFGGGALTPEGEFTIFQKSAQVKEYFMRETTMPRKPLINIRYEPHADPSKYQRLHIVGNDILHSPWATWLRLGMLETAVELCEKDPEAAQDLAEKLPRNLEQAITAFSADPEFKATTNGMDGKQYTALDYLDIVGDALKEAVGAGYVAVDGQNRERAVVMEEFDWARDAIRHNPDALDDLVDWRYRHTFLDKARSKGKTLLELAQLDIAVDDLCDRRLPQAYQGPIRQIGLERLAKVHEILVEDLEDRATDLYYVEPGGRAEVRAKKITEERTGPEPREKFEVDWDGWQLHDERVYIDHPGSQDLRKVSLNPMLYLRRDRLARIDQLPIDYSL